MYITITGVVYNTMLLPQYGLSSLNFVNVVLHIVVPLLAIFDWILFAKKGNIKWYVSFIWLVYPLIYFSFINLRVLILGSEKAALIENSPYPYFFIDPTFNNQGWGMVIMWLVILLIAFALLGLGYIGLDTLMAKRHKKTSQ